MYILLSRICVCLSSTICASVPPDATSTTLSFCRVMRVINPSINDCKKNMKRTRQQQEEKSRTCTIHITCARLGGSFIFFNADAGLRDFELAPPKFTT